MKMKLIVFASFFFSFFVYSQTKVNPDDQAIKKSLTYFVNSIKSKKMDQAVNCIYPKFFTAIPKDHMAQLLNMTYNNPFLKIEVQDLKLGTIEKPELISGEYFSIASYFLKLKCNVNTINDDMKKKIGEAMMTRYGKANVKYLKDKGIYLINANMRACAVSKDRKNWKFVLLEKEYKPQLVKVLPKKVLDKI